MQNVNIGIIGLGRVGYTLMKKLVNFHGKGITLSAVAEKDKQSEGVLLAQKHNIDVYDDGQDLVNLGAKLDIIFELTGDSGARRECRMSMVKSKNDHTVIAPEILAHLIWNIIGGDDTLPDINVNKGY